MAFNVGNLLGNIFGSESLFFIENPYVLELNQNSFIDYEIEALYKKLLFDCLSRSDGLPKAKTKSATKQSTEVDMSAYYDSVIVGDAGSKGLISYLAEAMRSKGKKYLVYIDEVIREADQKEIDQIEKGKFKNGASCDFSNYKKTDILKFYFSLFYVAISALNSQMNVSKALQIKISKMRELVGNKDAANAKSQAKTISTGLKNGSSVLMDELDKIETMKLDTKPAAEAIDMIVSRIAGVVGMPVSYINGLVSTGLTASGQGDESLVERGLQNIFNEIFKRVSDRLLGTNLIFKKNTWDLISERLKVLPIVESSTLFSEQEKKDFAQKALNP